MKTGKLKYFIYRIDLDNTLSSYVYCSTFSDNGYDTPELAAEAIGRYANHRSAMGTNIHDLIIVGKWVEEFEK